MNSLSVNPTEGAGFMRSAFKRLIFTQRVSVLDREPDRFNLCLWPKIDLVKNPSKSFYLANITAFSQAQNCEFSLKDSLCYVGEFGKPSPLNSLSIREEKTGAW